MLKSALKGSVDDLKRSIEGVLRFGGLEGTRDSILSRLRELLKYFTAHENYTACEVVQVLIKGVDPNTNSGAETMTNYQELLDGSAADCCGDVFGAGAGEDALTAALAEARADSNGEGWNTFLKKFLTSFETRLAVIPKIEIDATALLTLIGTWFDSIVGPMDFAWIPDSVEDVIKGLMKNALLMGAELIINKILGK